MRRSKDNKSVVLTNPGLSRVQELVLRGITYGLRYDEIGRSLELSTVTVGRIVATALKKFVRAHEINGAKDVTMKPPRVAGLLEPCNN